MVGVRTICSHKLENLATHWTPMLGSLLYTKPHKVMFNETVVSSLAANKSVVRHRWHNHRVSFSSERPIKSSLSVKFLFCIETFTNTVVQFFSHLVTDVTVNTGNFVGVTSFFTRFVRVRGYFFLFFGHIFCNSNCVLNVSSI